jgi:hypothetical protein
VKYLVVFLLGILLGGGAVALLIEPRGPESKPTGASPPSWVDLVGKDPEQLKRVGIAEMNLLCAEGLPGAENFDIPECLATLDRWAAHVRSETIRHLYRLGDPPDSP